jgi:hypothetical protein
MRKDQHIHRDDKMALTLSLPGTFFCSLASLVSKAASYDFLLVAANRSVSGIEYTFKKKK